MRDSLPTQMFLAGGGGGLCSKKTPRGPTRSTLVDPPQILKCDLQVLTHYLTTNKGNQSCVGVTDNVLPVTQRQSAWRDLNGRTAELTRLARGYCTTSCTRARRNRSGEDHTKTRTRTHTRVDGTDT